MMLLVFERQAGRDGQGLGDPLDKLQKGSECSSPFSKCQTFMFFSDFMSQ